VFLGERFEPTQWIGVVVVLVALAAILWRGIEPAARPATGPALPAE
jgi:drug/metabolite transporter (DMT)-like permease